MVFRIAKSSRDICQKMPLPQNFNNKDQSSIDTYLLFSITTAFGVLSGSPVAFQVMVPVRPSTVISVIEVFRASQISSAEASGVRPAFSIAAFRP